MEKILNIFGLTTLKSAEKKSRAASKVAAERALGQKPYGTVLDFARTCRKYKFRVVAVGVEESEALALSRELAEREFDADQLEQNQFTTQFIGNVKLSDDLELLK